jgi:hypothetical protein
MQYDKYLKRKGDEDYFEPVDERRKVRHLLSSNEISNLHSIFQIDCIENNRVLFLIQPSFEAQHLLSIEKSDIDYVLAHITLDRNYDLRAYPDNAKSLPKTIVSNGSLKNTLGNKLFQLIEQTITNAREPQGLYFMLDGTRYILSMTKDGVIPIRHLNNAF